MEERGLSPFVATVLLIAIATMAITPIAIWLTNYYAPFRPKYVNIVVYAGLIDDNIVRFNIQHVGGETIRFDYDKPTTEKIIGHAYDTDSQLENDMYGWVFENPERYRQSDWAYAEVQLHGAELAIGSTIDVTISYLGAGVLYEGTLTIDSVDQIPGG
jgi:hypothetical protein